MAIKLDIITEKLENISEGCYATDYVGDVVNWILNKPKPYRILYDSHFDVWVICDALMNTHKGMAIDLFDSDYLYGVARNLDGYVKFARNDGTFNSGYTDAEVYTDYGFDHYYIKGLFFIPYDKEYSDYENSSFYNIETPITTGTIFTSHSGEFSSTGIFKDLYNKLEASGAIKNTLPELFKQCRQQYGDKWLDYFYEEAEEWDYDEDEVNEFLNNYGILATLKEGKTMFIKEELDFQDYIDVLNELGFEPNPEKTPNSWNKTLYNYDPRETNIDINVDLDNMEVEITWFTYNGRIKNQETYNINGVDDIYDYNYEVEQVMKRL